VSENTNEQLAFLDALYGVLREHGAMLDADALSIDSTFDVYRRDKLGPWITLPLPCAAGAVAARIAEMDAEAEDAPAPVGPSILCAHCEHEIPLLGGAGLHSGCACVCPACGGTTVVDVSKSGERPERTGLLCGHCMALVPVTAFQLDSGATFTCPDCGCKTTVMLNTHDPEAADA